jgi:tetratricopeptide (TPR) repeat protein
VDKSEAKKIFLDANALYDRGQFDEALRLLQRLNLEFPRQKHILFAAARCLEEMGRAQECIALCEQLITLFDDERAECILSRLAGLENVEEPVLTRDGTRRLNHEDHRLIAMMMDPTSVTPFPGTQGQNRALLYGLGFAAFLLLFLIVAGSFGPGGRVQSRPAPRDLLRHGFLRQPGHHVRPAPPHAPPSL